MNRHDGQQQKQKDKQQQKVNGENKLSAKSPENTQIKTRHGSQVHNGAKLPNLIFLVMEVK